MYAISAASICIKKKQKKVTRYVTSPNTQFKTKTLVEHTLKITGMNYKEKTKKMKYLKQGNTK